MAAAVWRDCQRGFLPGGPCIEQTSAPSASKSAEKFPVERAETFTKSLGSLFLVQCCTWALGHFQSFFFLILAFVRKRKNVKDVSSFGMQSAPSSPPPDVILLD